MSRFNDRYNNLLNKARQVTRFGRCAWAVQSTGEQVAVALVLNRADWLEELGYTIAEAIDRAARIGSPSFRKSRANLLRRGCDASKDKSPQARLLRRHGRGGASHPQNTGRTAHRRRRVERVR